MTPDGILTSVVAIIAAVVASAVLTWIMRRGEERTALSTAVRHDEQIRALGQAFAELRLEVARQGQEMREMMQRITTQLAAMDARLIRLETRVEVWREQEGYSGVHSTDPRIPRYDPGADSR